MAIVTIVGSGMMGSALAFPLTDNGHEVRLVGTHLDRGIIEECEKTGKNPKFDRPFHGKISYHQIEALSAALDGADAVIGGVSSFGVDWFGENVLPAVDEKTPVLTVTKGLYDLPDGRLMTYPALWAERLAKKGLKRRLCAVGGPCTSYELVAEDQTEVTFCSADREALELFKKLMATDYYHISLTDDVTGVESAVALKNGYALAIALTIGLNIAKRGSEELHFNSQAAVFGQSVKEMSRLLDYQYSREDRFRTSEDKLNNLTLGAGDLYVTVYGGRTRKVGILLGEGLSLEEAKEKLAGVTLESLVVAERVARAVKAAAANGRLKTEDFPVLTHVDALMRGEEPAELPWEKFTF